MVKYFQLTPEILLEYIYYNDQKLNNNGVIIGGTDSDYDKEFSNEKNICEEKYETLLLKSDAFSSKYLCFKNDNMGLNSISNLVLPLNNTETQFVVAKNKYQKFYKKSNASNRISTKSGVGYIYEDINYDKNIKEIGKDCNVKYDKCIVHFTSRNYFGNYDSLIFQAYVYMNNKSKLYFSSFIFKKTSNVELKSENLLYNEKLYTTQIEFEIPSVFAILSNDSNIKNEQFSDALFKSGIEFLENTPIGINIYGVSGSTIGTDNYERLKTFKINSIYIPHIYNSLDEIHVDITESKDGDYYEINPEIGGRYSSFVNYIESIGGDVRTYMIMHELCLKESWVDEDNKAHSEITHKEFHIININEDDEDEEISKRFDAIIKYRPVCIKNGLGYKSTIIDTIKIINTADNTSYEVTGSENISNPNKYGLKLKTLDINRPIVNVYNKRNSSIGGINRTGNSGSGSGGSIGSGGNNGSGGNSGINSILGTIAGNFTGTLYGLGSDESDTSSSDQFGKGIISGTVTGNIPGFGKVTGAINSNIKNYELNSDTGDIIIKGPINISLSGTQYSGGENSSTGSNSSDTNGGVIVLNKKGGFVVENMTKNITSFIECTNIGVSIVELSPDDIN